MLNRREFFKLSAFSTATYLVPNSWTRVTATAKGPFRFCLNTSTISGRQSGLLHYIDTAAKAGYDGVELWVSDVKEYLNQGNSIQSLGSL